MTHYEALGASPDATHEELRAAYLDLARKWHPDLNDAGRQRQAEARMQQINDAWAVLGSRHQRRAYDAEINQGQPQPAGQGHARRGRAHFQPFDDEPVGRPDFDDDPTPYKGDPLPRWVTMAPVALVATSVGIFLFGLLVNARSIIAVGAVAFTVGAVGFLAVPLIVMSRAERDPGL